MFKRLRARSCKVYFYLLLVGICMAGVSTKSFGQSFDYPLIFDLDVNPSKALVPAISPLTTTSGFHAVLEDITPSSIAGHNLPANDPRIRAMWNEAHNQNRPVSLTLLNTTAPVNGTIDPTVLTQTMDYLSTNNLPLNFVFADFEPVTDPATRTDITTMVSQVRGYADSQINQAYVGNYDCFPGAYDAAEPDPNGLHDRSFYDTFYRTSGVNVAMPVAYQWAAYELHADPVFWAGNLAPNKRSGLFWGSLETVSTPAREIHNDPTLAGDKLIPWVGGYIPYTDRFTPIPLPHEDQARLMEHYRLRGADGYYYYRSLDTGWYDPKLPTDYAGNENQKAAYMAKWKELDWLFDGVNKNDVEIMNLATDKNSGFQWSASETPNGAAVLLSNLGNSSQYFSFSELLAAGMSQQSIDALGGAGASVGVGEHLLLTTQPDVAPAVHYTFKETSSGNWEVLVDVTGTDTTGLSAYEIWVDGVDPATVSYSENVLGDSSVGFLPGNLVYGDVDGSFNAGSHQGSGLEAIEGIGMVAVNEAGVVLDAQALLGTLTTDPGLTEANFRVITAGLLGKTGDEFYDGSIVPTISVIPLTALLLGDANNDGVVSAADYASVQANFGHTGAAGILGDANGDGVVSAADYASVQANFGNVASPVVTPEPVTCVLLSISGAMMLIRKRRANLD